MSRLKCRDCGTVIDSDIRINCPKCLGVMKLMEGEKDLNAEDEPLSVAEPAAAAFQMELMPVPDDLAARPKRIGKAEVGYREARAILNPITPGFLDGYDYSLNPYMGCTLSCSYCYALKFSNVAGKSEDDWGNWVIAKENAIALMRSQKHGALDGKRIYMSSVTDAYQPVERRMKLTRGILELLAEDHLPKLVVQTRSPDVLRDTDLFLKIEERGGRVQVNITVTTDSEDVRKAFEPMCPSTVVRLKAAKQLVDAGIQTCITITPMLLIKDNWDFSGMLQKTGVKRFIVQRFHAGEAKFVAGTREMAFEVMADVMGWDRADVLRKYDEQYVYSREELRRWLPSLVEGKAGFAPPF